MTRIADLRRRLDAVSVAFSGTITAKVIKLTDDRRVAYDQWRCQMATYCASHPDGGAYARIINGDGPPPPQHDVHLALFGATIGIPADASEAQAAEAYSRVLRGD